MRGGTGLSTSVDVTEDTVSELLTVKLLNGHTEHAAAIKPGTRLFEDRSLCAPAIAGEVHIDFYSQVDAGDKTGTLRTSPYSICGVCVWV